MSDGELFAALIAFAAGHTDDARPVVVVARQPQTGTFAAVARCRDVFTGRAQLRRARNRNRAPDYFTVWPVDFPPGHPHEGGWVFADHPDGRPGSRVLAPRGWLG